MVARNERQYRPLSTDETDGSAALSLGAVSVMADNVNNAAQLALASKIAAYCWPGDMLTPAELIGEQVVATFGLRACHSWPIRWRICASNSGSASVYLRVYAHLKVYSGPALFDANTLGSSGVDWWGSPASSSLIAAGSTGAIVGAQQDILMADRGQRHVALTITAYSATAGASAVKIRSFDAWPIPLLNFSIVVWP